MKPGDREKVQALIKQAIREWNELRTDVPLTSYIAEWLLLNGLVFAVRCKNCKFGEMCSIREAMCCTDENGYCYRGERRTENE